MVLGFDSADDARTLLGRLGLTACKVVGRYLFPGATAADGSVPEPVATPLSTAEVAAIHAAGLAMLLVDNGIGWGDTTGPAAYGNGQRKARAAIAAAEGIGTPASVYIAADLEDWAVDGPFLSGYCAAMRASGLGGAGILYGSLGGAWRSTHAAVAQTDENVARALNWVAWYSAEPWDGRTIPAAIPSRLSTVPNLCGWQFTGTGPRGVDLNLFLPHPGLGGLWLPSGEAGWPS